VEFYGWYEDNMTVYLAMEYFPLGDLGNFIENDISEDSVREIASQLLQGLAFMHAEGYTHRDLKPAVSSPGPVDIACIPNIIEMCLY
jgi:serine/threonine protein kinase